MLYSALEGIDLKEKDHLMDRSTTFGLRRPLVVRCLHALLVLVALLLTVDGCCLVGTGIFVYLSERFERPLLTHLAIGAITLGAGSITTGILGCIAGFTKRTALHVTFTVSAACGLLASLVVGSWLFLQRSTLLVDSTTSLRIAIETYFDDDKSRQFMNDVQHRLNCCGADLGLADYGIHSSEDLSAVCDMQFYGTPCHEPFSEYLSQKLLLVLGLTAASGFLLVILLIQFLVMVCVGSRSNADDAI